MNGESITVRKKIIGYAICFGIGAGLFFLVCWLERYPALETDQERLRVLCDAFTIPGLLLAAAAGLVFAANNGTFYGLGYGLRTAKQILLPFLPSEHVKYRDYIAKKKEKKVSGYGFILISGLVFLLVGIILLIRFNMLYPNA